MEQLQAEEEQRQRRINTLDARTIFDFICQTEQGVPRTYNRWIMLLERYTKDVGFETAFEIKGDVLLTTIDEAIVALGQHGVEATPVLRQERLIDDFGVIVRNTLKIELHVKRTRPLRRTL